MPTLDRLQAALGGPDFEVVALSINRGGLEVVKNFYAEIGVQHLAIHIDTANFELATAGLPTTLLIDRQGQELGRLVGPAEWDTPDMAAFLKSIIAKKEDWRASLHRRAARLVFGRIQAHHILMILMILMKRWSARQILALFLAVFVAVGTTLTTVQANTMTATMTMASGMGASGHDGCRDCPKGCDGMKSMVCASVCVAPVLTVLPQVAPMTFKHEPVRLSMQELLHHGRTLVPDPPPPRPSNIG
jgi:hypothetical protein